MLVICPVCKGEGVIKERNYIKTSSGKIKPESDIKRCYKCDGKGHLEQNSLRDEDE